MSACNNIFWAGLGAAAGFDDDGEGPNLRVVDDDDESSDG